MIFRAVGYLLFFVLLVYIDLLLISKKPDTFTVVWKKTTLYSITFVIYIVLCYLLDFVLCKFGIY
ncbi:MAG: hypothetical protein UD936_09815 [Acutalibacteraceae bacterium]|nr:hypothetical protein [Acutalibacteraceae bacterium]